jgi:hypothetical protein
MEFKAKITAPGLGWSRGVPYWRAKKAAIQAGYPIKNVNLSSVPLEQLADRCERLQAECRAWLAGDETLRCAYDGTLGSLLAIYQTHEDSPYHALKPGSRATYDKYLRKLGETYGDQRLRNLTGLDIKRWHKLWRTPQSPGAHEKLGVASMALKVLKSVVTFGVVCGVPDCARMREFMSVLRLPQPRPREQAPAAADVAKAIAAAHELGRHRAALCYAIQFETTARQWDVLGQWVPMSDPRPSAIFDNGEKWIGPTWAAIDESLTLTLTPSTKTEKTTKASVHVHLRNCPMVMAELARIPPEERVGPLIVNERGAPYRQTLWQYVWREVRERAGLSEALWNRDLRAGGITEAEKAGVSSDDRSKLAGHSAKINREVYSRDRLAASDRVAEARNRFRERES